MNAHQRRVARRKNDIRTITVGVHSFNIYGPKSEAFRRATRQVHAGVANMVVVHARRSGKTI